MNKIIPFNTFAKSSLISDTSVVLGEKDNPLGFVFGRDAFITFLEKMDEEFEKKVKNKNQAFNNPAGNLIDLIEENLPVNPALIKELKASRTKNNEWIPLDKVVQTLHV